MLAALAACEQEFDRRNVLLAGELAARFAALRVLLWQGRAPRVAVLGRRGAGKSSLLNAVAGEGLAVLGDVEDATRTVQPYPVRFGARAVEWLDTPGLRAGGRPGRREVVLRALTAAPPDVLLLLCPASEVDAGIDADLEDVRALVAGIAAVRGRAPALMALATKVDELAPPDVYAPPFDDPEKRARIREAVGVFGRHLRRVGLRPHGTLPVNTYVRFEQGTLREDLRWNLPALLARVEAALPTEAEIRARWLPAELRRALVATMEGITEAFAQRAASGAGEAELQALHRELGRLLRALGPEGELAARAGVRLDALTRPTGALEALRQGLARAGGRGAAAAMAGARLRLLGATLRRQLAETVPDAALARLYPPRD
jgi:predicted GTPase